VGWNDRLREDPALPSEEDSYEGWLLYSEELRAAEAAEPCFGLTSQNIDPATRVAAQQDTDVRASLNELIAKLKAAEKRQTELSKPA